MDIYVKISFISTFPLFLWFFDHDFIICIDFTRRPIAASE